MKRIGNIYPQICTMENLIAAEKKARKGKANQYGVRVFDRNPEANLVLLQDMLINKTFRTSKYTTRIIHEPKEREIFCLPYFPDRIAQHAIMNILEPIFTASYTADTYSCIKGRGIHAALFALEKALRSNVAGTKYCLQIDIRKFYPSIDHTIMKGLLYHKFKDNDLLSLLFGIVDSAPGVPIGNYTSQHFANYYLTPFDHYVKEQLGVIDYFRYADDMIFPAADKKYLHHLLGQIREYLHDNVKLDIKSNYQVYPVQPHGINAFGYVVRHSHTELRPSIKKRMARMIRHNRHKASLSAYKGWTDHASCRHLMKKLLA